MSEVCVTGKKDRKVDERDAKGEILENRSTIAYQIVRTSVSTKNDNSFITHS